MLRLVLNFTCWRKSQPRKSENEGVLSMSNIETENFGRRNVLLALQYMVMSLKKLRELD